MSRISPPNPQPGGVPPGVLPFGGTRGRRLVGAPARGLSRRSLLRGAGLAGAAAFLSACSIPSVRVTGYTPVPDTSARDKTLNWSNWPFYIDVAADGSDEPTTLEKFEQKTGIKVTYTEDVNDNDSYFAKIQPQLSGGQTIGADVFVVTDWMAAKMIRLGFAVELDHSKMPNLKNMRADLQQVDFDPGRKYSVTWQSGMAGIAVNPDATGGREVTSIDQLLTDRSLRGKVTLLSEMRDTVGITLTDMGYDATNFTMDQFDAAIAKLQAAVDAGQIRKFTGNDYGADLVAGNVAACIAWSGDIVSLRADNEGLTFQIPEAGGTLWSDNFLVPIRSPHKTNAEELINFYYQPDIAAQAEDFINYVSPVDGTKEAMQELDPDLVSDELIFPTDETLARCHVFMALDDEQENRCNRAFAKLTGA